MSPKAIAEMARIEYGARFDNYYIAPFARRLLQEHPELRGVVRVRKTRIPWDKVDNGKEARMRTNQDLDKRIAQLKALAQALEALKRLEEREKFLRPYGLDPEQDFVWLTLKGNLYEAVKALMEEEA